MFNDAAPPDGSRTRCGTAWFVFRWSRVSGSPESSKALWQPLCPSRACASDRSWPVSIDGELARIGERVRRRDVLRTTLQADGFEQASQAIRSALVEIEILGAGLVGQRESDLEALSRW